MTQETKHTGYRSKEYGIPTKRYCQCLELRDNQELIAKYREFTTKSMCGKKSLREYAK